VRAVITFSAEYIGADNYAISDLERDVFEVVIAAVPANGSDGSDVFVSLDDRKRDLPAGSVAGILSRVALKCVLVGSANPGQLHFDQNASWLRLRERVFAHLISARFDEGSGQYAHGALL
jgi:hypothetical protein